MQTKNVYLYNIMSKSFPDETRAAQANNIVENQQTNRDINKLGFISKSSKSWNVLSPHQLLLKIWIKENVPSYSSYVI